MLNNLLLSIVQLDWESNVNKIVIRTSPIDAANPTVITPEDAIENAAELMSSHLFYDATR
jgi:hypothetical protein